MSRITLKNVAKVKEEAENGVDYSPRYGAACPSCGRPAKIYKTLPWEENTRTRYHRCRNPRCLVSSMGLTIKSIQVDG